MDEKILNWLAAGVVGLWVMGACVRPLVGGNRPIQAFSQSTVQNRSFTANPRLSVNRQVRPNYRY